MSSEKQAFTMAITAPRPGYAPQGRYDPKAYPSPQQGYPPAQGYPPNQPGYPPAQPGYPGQPPYGNTAQQNSTVVVTQQPYTATGVVAGPNPPDYLVASILACLCCFWPTGLCAIYFACRRDTLMAEGNNFEANRMATNARNLTILSFVLGIIWIVVVIVTNRYRY